MSIWSVCVENVVGFVLSQIGVCKDGVGDIVKRGRDVVWGKFISLYILSLYVVMAVS